MSSPLWRLGSRMTNRREIVKRGRIFYFQQKQINLTLLVLGGCFLIFLIIWLVVLPLNFSKRFDIKRVIKATQSSPKYKITAYVPPSDSQLPDVIKGEADRSANKMDLDINTGDIPINFLVGTKVLFDPLGYLTYGVRAQDIGKTRIDGKINRWFRVTGLNEGRVGKINSSLKSLTGDNFGDDNLVSYDIYFGEESNLVNRVVINYKDDGVQSQVKLEFSDYEK